jgi:hypothetical protein
MARPQHIPGASAITHATGARSGSKSFVEFASQHEDLHQQFQSYVAETTLGAHTREVDRSKDGPQAPLALRHVSHGQWYYLITETIRAASFSQLVAMLEWIIDHPEYDIRVGALGALTLERMSRVDMTAYRNWSQHPNIGTRLDADIAHKIITGLWDNLPNLVANKLRA